MFFAASLFLAASASSPAPSPEFITTKTFVDKFRAGMLGAAREFTPKCNVPRFTQCDYRRCVAKRCLCSGEQAQRGVGQNTCAVECQEAYEFDANLFPGCELEASIAEALVGKNITRAFLSNGTLPRGDDVIVLTALAQRGGNNPDDVFTSMEDGAPLLANLTRAKGCCAVMTELYRPHTRNTTLGV